MRKNFLHLSDALFQHTSNQLTLELGLIGEQSDFCRFNQGLVRQAGNVAQAELSLHISQGSKQVQGVVRLSQNFKLDWQNLLLLYEKLKSQIVEVPEDPYFDLAIGHSSEQLSSNSPDLPLDSLIDSIIHRIRNLDFVGFLAQGSIFRGFSSNRNNQVQFNWFETPSFNFDWSLYYQKDLAIKQSYSDKSWSKDSFNVLLEQGKQELELLKKPRVHLTPGQYRVYFCPQAVNEIFELLSWGAFSGRRLCTKQSALQKLYSNERCFSPKVTIYEDYARGMVANFNMSGINRPERIQCIEFGKYADSFISMRTAKEFGLKSNGANASESPESLSMEPGNLPPDEILTALDDGIYINNLWYLNYSDRENCSMTGMTRFACFWVKAGQIKGPINVMRFDDSLYGLLGDRLMGLSTQRQLIISSNTYNHRHTENMLVPGALVDGVRFTL